MNQQFHKALEGAIKSKVAAEKAIAAYDLGRKPLLKTLKECKLRHAKLETCVFTGEWQPELFEEETLPTEYADGPPDEPPPPRGESDYFGRRQRATKPKRERADAKVKSPAPANGFTVFETTPDGRADDMLRQRLEQIEREEIERDEIAADEVGRCMPVDKTPGWGAGWSDIDFDKALRDALDQKGAAKDWAKLTKAGATDMQIESILMCIWPRSIKHVGSEPGIREWGYTVQTDNALPPRFWMGALAGPTQEPDLEGPALIRRIREMFRIPAAAPDRATMSENGRAEFDRSQPLETWTSDDLNEAIDYAVHSTDPSARTAWSRMIHDGATNAEILSQLEGQWPSHGKRFIGKDETKKSFGFTISCAGGTPCLWMGAFRGIGHKAAIHGEELVRRIRDVIEIPTPSQAAKAAKQTFEHPVTGVTRCAVYRPDDGWDAASVANAAEDLGVPIGRLVECRPCGAIREHGDDQGCPYCGSTISGPPRGYYGNESITANEPKKKGRGKANASATK
jgi:hypothetical protein